MSQQTLKLHIPNEGNSITLLHQQQHEPTILPRQSVPAYLSQTPSTATSVPHHPSQPQQTRAKDASITSEQAANSSHTERSPTRPPVSPISAEEVAEQLARLPPHKPPAGLPAPKFVARPAPVPISESENTDAIALRSAIALLQLQREKSRKDLQTLVEVKQAALRDPTGFVEEAQKREAGKRQARKAGHNAPKVDVLTPTLQDRIQSLHANPNATPTVSAPTTSTNSPSQPSSVDPEANSTTAGRYPTTSTSPPSSASSSRSQSPNNQHQQPAHFPLIPTPQNVFRCPPINWAKYHVAGASLDKLHEEQRQRPTPGYPEGASAGYPETPGYFPPSVVSAGAMARNQPYVLAAPYSPLNDLVGGQGDGFHPMQTRRGSKKPLG